MPAVVRDEHAAFQGCLNQVQLFGADVNRLVIDVNDCHGAVQNAYFASNASTEMSSSISSQWMPRPPPMSLHFPLCAFVALSYRGHHCSGARISRPSASTTRKALGVTWTSVAKGLNFAPEVFMPFLQKQFFVLFNEANKPPALL